MGVGDNIRINLFHSPDKVIRIHPNHGRLLSLTPRQTCTCVCGNQSTEALVLLDPLLSMDNVLLSDELFRRIMLDGAHDWVGAQVVKGSLSVGPTIGILCNPVWDEKQGTLRNTKQLPGLMKLIEAGEKAGALLYVFKIQDVDFQRLRVNGFVRRNGTWKRATLPLPDAIYDQVISRKIEKEPKYLSQRNRLSTIYGPRIFNDGFFDKWQVHEWLTSDQRTRMHVPHTIRYTGPSAMVSFLKEHPVTFLKPVHGSLGLGIVRLMRQVDGSVVYDMKRQKGRSGGVLDGLEAVLSTFRSRLKNHPYLIQQGIRLATYKERPFDVRIVLQRDGDGAWKRTKMFARVAKEGDFTSNISSGGEALPVDTVLAELYPHNAKRNRCRRLIRKVSNMTTEVIEMESGKTFGELGVDMGIDDDGNVWVIEVNSKPWKSPTTKTGRQDLVELAFTRPIQYALRLAKSK